MSDSNQSPADRRRGSAKNSLSAVREHWKLWLALVACLLGYWVLFARQPIGPAPISRGMLYLLLPFDPVSLVQQWCGGDSARIGILDRVPIILVAGLWLLAAFLAGSLLLSLIRLRTSGRLEWVSFATPVGLHLLSLFVLCWGLCAEMVESLDVRSRWPLGGLFVVLAIVAVARRQWIFPVLSSDSQRSPQDRQADRSADQSGGQSREEFSRSSTRLAWLAAPFVMLLIGAAALPPYEFDVREYHLQAPKEWYQQGGIDFMPHNVYANMPLGAELHALGGMILHGGKDAAWRGALVGKLVIAAMNFLTAMALYCIAARFATRRAGAIAAVLYISWPWAFQVAAAGLIDGALALYVALTFLALSVFLGKSQDANSTPQDAGSTPHDEGSSPHGNVMAWLMVAAISAGAAASCKYTGLIFALVPGGLWCGLTLLRSRGGLAAAKATAIFVLTAAVVASPWYLKNAVQTGNPTYPLLASVFGGRTRSEAKTKQWNDAHQTPRDAQGRQYSLSQAASSTARVLWRSPWHHPLVVPLATLCLFGTCFRRFSFQTLLAAGALFLVWFVFTHRIDRFWLPCGPLMCLAAGLGADQGRSPFWQRTINTLLFIASVSVFCFLASRYATPDNRIFVSYRELREDIQHAADPYTWTLTPEHRFLNENTPQGEAVLLVGDAQPFDLKPRVFYNTCFDDNWLELWMKGRAPSEQLQALKNRHVAFVLVDWNEIERYRNTYGFSDFVQPSVFRQLERDGVLAPVSYEGRSRSVAIYAVRSDLAPISPNP